MKVSIGTYEAFYAFNESEVDSRAGEVDEPEGSAPPVEAGLVLESPAGTWRPFPTELSLTLARSLVAKGNGGK